MGEREPRLPLCNSESVLGGVSGLENYIEITKGGITQRAYFREGGSDYALWAAVILGQVQAGLERGAINIQDLVEAFICEN